MRTVKVGEMTNLMIVGSAKCGCVHFIGWEIFGDVQEARELTRMSKQGYTFTREVHKKGRVRDFTMCNKHKVEKRRKEEKVLEAYQSWTVNQLRVRASILGMKGIRESKRTELVLRVEECEQYRKKHQRELPLQ